MLVCPGCRNENLEEAGFCRACGRSLEPVASFARRVEREEAEESDLELPAPRRGGRWAALALLVVGMLAVSGWAIFATAQPNPCRGRFSSSLYPYCAQIPQGWGGGAALDGTETIDRFVRDSQEVEAVANVRVEEIVDPTVQTQQYAQQFRTSQEADGLDPSSAEVVELDGEQALAWNYTVAGTTEAEPPLLIREVVMVRSEGAWRVTLIATEEVYQEARIAFERMLDSWRWKS